MYIYIDVYLYKYISIRQKYSFGVGWGLIMAGNTSLNKANKAKNDEFYTQLSDVEVELKHYRKHFKDKVIFCNCSIQTMLAKWC